MLGVLKDGYLRTVLPDGPYNAKYNFPENYGFQKGKATFADVAFSGKMALGWASAIGQGITKKIVIA